MNEDRRAFLDVVLLQIGMTRQEALAVHGAGGDPADALAAFVDHRGAVMRRADALLIEAEAHHHALAFLLARCVSIPADEPGLIEFDVGAKSAFPNSQI